jgi:hypothetical protein
MNGVDKGLTGSGISVPFEDHFGENLFVAYYGRDSFAASS